MDPMLRGGRVGGLLQQGSSSPPPPAAAAVPVFEVAAYDVEDGTCWYSTSVVPHPGANRLEVAVRWSEMEAIVKELRAHYPAMPEALALPKYYFKTTDDAKLEQRCHELNEFWAGFMGWLEGQSTASAEGLLDTAPLQRMLADAEEISAVSAIAAPAVGERPAHSGHRAVAGSGQVVPDSSMSMDAKMVEVLRSGVVAKLLVDSCPVCPRNPGEIPSDLRAAYARLLVALSLHPMQAGRWIALHERIGSRDLGHCRAAA